MKKQLITLSLAVASSAFGVNLPTSGDIQRQVQQPKFEEEQKTLPTVSKEYKAPMVLSDSVTTKINGFTFSGNTIYDVKTLQVLLKSYEGKELGVNGLKEVTSFITKYYRDHNYFVARAYLPEQKIKDGIVEIAIIEGTYGNFEVNNNSLVKDGEVQNYMDQLKNGQIVSTKSLERQMLLVNDLSGVQIIKAEVYPGKEIGTSDFSITTAPTNKYNGYVVADNYGSIYTGEDRVSMGLNINSLSHVGDTLSFSGMLSNSANLTNGAVSYDRPLGYTGLKGSLNASSTSYKLEHINNYDSYGTANNFGAGLSYPTIKTRSHTQTISLDYLHRTMKDDAGIPDSVQESLKSSDALTLAFSDKSNTSIFDHQGKLFAKVSGTLGKLSLDNAVATNNDTQINTQGNYSKVNLDITHTQQFNPRLSLQTDIKTQKSFGKNLNSTEKISVGGSNGVRAYEDSELNGDQGFLFSTNLIYALPKVNQINHSASLFVDSAQIWKNANVYSTLENNTRNINAVGIGYILNYKNFDLKASFATGFGGESTPVSEAEFSTSKNKFLVQGMMRF